MGAIKKPKGSASPKPAIVGPLFFGLLVVAWLWVRAEKRASYIEGRESVYQDLAQKEIINNEK